MKNTDLENAAEIVERGLVTLADNVRHADPSSSIGGVASGVSDIAAAMENIDGAIRLLSHAVTADACGTEDETGGHVESLTEAVVGVTYGLMNIARALDRLADAAEKAVENMEGD